MDIVAVVVTNELLFRSNSVFSTLRTNFSTCTKPANVLKFQMKYQLFFVGTYVSMFIF